jgi:hypothetical protein
MSPPAEIKTPENFFLQLLEYTSIVIGNATAYDWAVTIGREGLMF